MSIFAEDKLHSAIWKQVFIALVCIIFAEEKKQDYGIIRIIQQQKERNSR